MAFNSQSGPASTPKTPLYVGDAVGGDGLGSFFPNIVVAFGAITTSKLALNCIGTAQLQDGSVTPAKLGVNFSSIVFPITDPANILSGLLIDPNISPNAAIQSSKLADYGHFVMDSGNVVINGIKNFTGKIRGIDPIVPSDLSTKNYVDVHIAGVNTVSSGSLQSASVSGNAIAANSILAGHLSDNSIQTSRLQVGSISGNVIATGAILNGNIGLNTIANNQLQSASISGNAIGNGAILAGHLGNNIVGNANLKSAAVSGNAIGTGAILTGHLSDNSIQTSRLQVGSISGNVIGTGVILTGNIGNNVLTNAQHQSASISGNVIATQSLLEGMHASNSLSNRLFQSGVVSGNAIAANSILTGHLSDNSIQTSRLQVGSISGNVIGNQAILNGHLALASISGNVIDAGSRLFEIATNGTFAGTEKRLNLVNGTNVTITAADNPGSSRVDVTINSTGGGSPGPNSITNAMLQSAAVSGNAIATQSLLEGQHASNSLSNRLFQSGAVSGNAIAANSILAGHLSDNSIQTSRLQTGSISGSVIATGVILTGNIGNNVLTNAQHQSASISGNVIAANSILAGHLSDNSIQTSRLQVGSVSGSAIATNGISQGNILSGYVDLSTAQSIVGTKTFKDALVFKNNSANFQIRTDNSIGFAGTGAYLRFDNVGNVLLETSPGNVYLAADEAANVYLAVGGGNVGVRTTGVTTALSVNGAENVSGITLHGNLAFNPGTSINGNNVVTQGNVTNGYVDLTSNQGISGTKTFANDVFLIGPTGSTWKVDQNGSLELGGNNFSVQTHSETPYIDFHFGGGVAKDYDARIVADNNNQLSIATASGIALVINPNTMIAYQPTTINAGAKTIPLAISNTGANDSFLTIDNGAGGNNAGVLLRDAGTNTWLVTKDTSNNFQIYDYANSRNALTFTGANDLATFGGPISATKGINSPNIITTSNLQVAAVSGNAISADTINFLKSGSSANSISTSMLQVGSISGNVIATPGLSQDNILSGYCDLRTNQSISGSKTFANTVYIRTGADSYKGLVIQENSTTQSAPLIDLLQSDGVSHLLQIGNNPSIPSEVMFIGGNQTFGVNNSGLRLADTFTELNAPAGGTVYQRINDANIIVLTPTAITASQPVTINAGAAQVLTVNNTGANSSSILINNSAGGYQSSTQFQDAGVTKWQLGKQVDNSFFLYDAAASVDVMRAGNGAVSFPNGSVSFSKPITGNNIISNSNLESAAVSGNAISADTINFLKAGSSANSISTSMLQVGSVSGNALAANSVLTGHLTNNLISTTNLQSASVSGNALAANSILAGHLANNIIANSNLQSASVSGNAIATQSILTGHIGNNVLTNAQHQSASISGNIIAMQAIGPNQLGYASVLSGNISQNSVGFVAMQLPSVSGNILAANSILTGHLSDNSIQTSRLQVGSISGNTLAADTVNFLKTAGSIPNNFITNAMLQSAIVSGNAIAANSILAGHLALASVSGNVITPDMVTFLKTATLGNNSITNAQFQSGVVSGNAISADTVTFLKGTTLGNNSVSTAMLQVGSVSGNVIATPGLSQGNILSGYVDLSTAQSIVGTKTFKDALVFKNNSANFQIRTDNSTGGVSTQSYIRFDGSGNVLLESVGGAVYLGADANVPIYLGAGGGNTGLRTAAPTTALSVNGAENVSGITLHGNLVFSPGTNINGSNVISNLNITNASISGNTIAANSILTGHLNNNLISTSNLQVGSVSGNIIAANSILAGHLSDNSIQTSRLQVGSISGNVIAANSILTGHLTNNLISTANQQVGSTSGSVIAANSILAGHLANNIIANGTLMSASVSGNAISADTITFLKSGASTPSAIKETINQTAHGFSVGNVIFYQNLANAWQKATANNAYNAEALGIVDTVVDSNNFSITYNGKITTLSGINAGSLYFLDPQVAGALNPIEPSYVGQISRPILVGLNLTTGIIKDYRASIIQSGNAVVAGNTNYIAKFTSGNSVQSSNVIYETGSQIGLGTTTPNATLAVNGTFTAQYRKLEVLSGVSAPYTLQTSDSHSIITDSLSGTKTVETGLQLPTPASGLQYDFIVRHPLGMRIQVASGSFIQLGQILTSPAGIGYIETTTSGSNVRLYGLDNMYWHAFSWIGPWTVN